MILDLKELHKKYEMNVKGVLHIGAHIGQENGVYDELQYTNRMFFEPLTKNYEQLANNVHNWTLKKIALGPEQGEKEMYVETANNGQSSSLLKPKIHLDMYPHITFPDKETVTMDTLDNVMDQETEESGEDHYEMYNFINMDVQGYELEVLKGSLRMLNHIDYVMCEVNNDEVYEDCCMITEIDEFLKPYGFKRVEENWLGGCWGDAFYVKIPDIVPDDEAIDILEAPPEGEDVSTQSPELPEGMDALAVMYRHGVHVPLALTHEQFNIISTGAIDNNISINDYIISKSVR